MEKGSLREVIDSMVLSSAKMVLPSEGKPQSEETAGA
jgi:hypothetical protein